MKVTGISMVRNEADVIEAFVRHHAEIVDELVVIDHSSTDGTGDLLQALAAEGLPISVREEHSLVHRQNVVLTALMREAAEAGGADWVVPLDADEFLVAPDGDVRGALGALPGDSARALELRLYVPCPDDPPEEMNVLRRIRHRLVGEITPWTTKVIVPSAHARGGRCSLAQGSHRLLDARTDEFMSTPLADRPALAHFPVRSARQLARKALGAWPAEMARPDRSPTGAWQWKRAFDDAVAGRVTPRRLQTLALQYSTRDPNGRRSRQLVLDPVPAGFELRHDLPAEPPPLAILAETAVRVAEELSEALRR